MELTPVYWIYWILFLDSCGFTACQSPGFLIVRPNRRQFLEYESVSLSCEVQGGSTGWRVKRNLTSGNLTRCGDGWGKFDGTSCNISSTKSADSGVYWCQSESGEHSNTVNITITDVILEIPILPVTEGNSVTLSCRRKETSSDLTADFYKDGSFIRTESTGEMTIPAVNKSDEGWYWCRHPKGNSPKSRMTVTGGLVILESPALPVTEGSNVTLKCKYRESSTTKKSFPYKTAGFYKHGSLIFNGTTEAMTISKISRSDEGIWKCKCPNHGESPESRMTVTAATPSTPPSSIPSTPPSPIPSTPPSSIPSTHPSSIPSSTNSSTSSLLIPLSVSGLAGLSISLILFLLFCYQKRTKDCTETPLLLETVIIYSVRPAVGPSKGGLSLTEG